MTTPNCHDFRKQEHCHLLDVYLLAIQGESGLQNLIQSESGAQRRAPQAELEPEPATALRGADDSFKPREAVAGPGSTCATLGAPSPCASLRERDCQPNIPHFQATGFKSRMMITPQPVQQPRAYQERAHPSPSVAFQVDKVLRLKTLGGSIHLAHVHCAISYTQAH
eukprot:TRINITY_DN35229_c0_g1_i1.p2 TRINITY_DN35229_c0_g1~~TRINITY_DN35229_c0_g1_i1.p2  ORF type:complete len:167 (+),score=1.89 TRINITY_DN35229_c0_g1_i1:162-662(+)